MTFQKKDRYCLFIYVGVVVIFGVLIIVSCQGKTQTTVQNITSTLTEVGQLPAEPTTTPTIPSKSNAQAYVLESRKTPVLNLQELIPTTKTPTSTPFAFTSTPTSLPSDIPTTIPETSTPIVPCNQLSNLVDVTIPAGTPITAGQSFVKIWNIQNTGSCTWNSNYHLELSAGFLDYPQTSIDLGESVSPGTVWPISIDFTAPLSPGAYYDTWKLYTDSGQPLTDENGQEVDFPISIIVLPTTAQISGRITIDGALAGSGINLSLEDANNQSITTLITSPDGAFSFVDLPASSDGYYVVFSEVTNPQFGMDQVVSWAWIGPIATQGGDAIQLSDIDISRLGFGQISPAPEAIYSSASLSPSNPIQFTWAFYPNAIDYWVDLVRGEEENVWQSQLVPGPSTGFDGTLSDGSHIPPDEYWWAVGARCWVGDYSQIVYTYLTSLSIED